MTVEQLIEVLSKLENKNIPILFSYDSRVVVCGINCVDLVQDSNQDQRICAADFFEHEEPKTTQAIVFRSELDYEYDWFHILNEFNEDGEAIDERDIKYQLESMEQYKDDVNLFFEEYA
jgi:hypothetical protein